MASLGQEIAQTEEDSVTKPVTRGARGQNCDDANAYGQPVLNRFASNESEP